MSDAVLSHNAWHATSAFTMPPLHLNADINILISMLLPGPPQQPPPSRLSGSRLILQRCRRRSLFASFARATDMQNIAVFHNTITPTSNGAGAPHGRMLPPSVYYRIYYIAEARTFTLLFIVLLYRVITPGEAPSIASVSRSIAGTMRIADINFEDDNCRSNDWCRRFANRVMAARGRIE